jgi:hypothetical protein
METRGAGRRAITRTAAILTVATTVLAACGASDDDSAAPTNQTTTTAAGETTTTAAEDTDLAAFCAALVDIDTDTGPDIDFENATDEEQTKAIQDYATQFEPKLQAAEESAPAEVEDAVATAVGMFREGLSTGDDSFFESPEFNQANNTIDEYALGNCDFEEVSVTAVEYAFQGVPEMLEAGQTAFSFANDGGELHELAIFRINDGVETPLEELLQLPEEQQMRMSTPIGFGFAPPGDSDNLFLDLEPGRYAMLCFLPVGSTPESDEEQVAENPPHFTQGMVAEFTVE